MNESFDERHDEKVDFLSHPTMALVNNAQIKSAELFSPLPLYFHAYIWPFAIIWPVFARYFYTPELYEKHIGSSEWTFVWCATIITAQSLVWLSTHWSVNLEGTFTAVKAKKVEDAKLIKVIPIANAGSGEICELHHDKVRFSISEYIYVYMYIYIQLCLTCFPHCQAPSQANQHNLVYVSRFATRPISPSSSKSVASFMTQ